MTTIGVIGNGRSGKLIERYWLGSKTFSVRFFDEFNGEPLSSIPPGMPLIVSFSIDMKRRREVFEQFSGHPFVNVMRSQTLGKIGRGNIVYPGCHMDYFSEIGDNNAISHNCVINHCCKVGSHNLFGPGVLLSGSVTIGDRCKIGTNVAIEPHITIGDDVMIASGSTIIGNLPSGAHVKRKSNDLRSYGN